MESAARALTNQPEKPLFDCSVELGWRAYNTDMQAATESLLASWPEQQDGTPIQRGGDGAGDLTHDDSKAECEPETEAAAEVVHEDG